MNNHQAAGPPIRETLYRYGLGQQWTAAARAAETRRIGQTATQRLEWVIALLDRDLSVAHDGEIEALGYDLRYLTAEALPRGTSKEFIRGRLTRAALIELQSQLVKGVQALFDTGEWTLPRPEAMWLRRSPEGAVFNDTRLTSVLSQILHGVAELIRQVGPRFRRCAEPDCGRPFIQSGRQSYHSPKCSTRVRNRRKAQ
jgi:hypothetical protein